MAVGFTPKHSEEIELNDFTPEQFLMLLKIAAEEMKWEVGYISAAGLIAYTDNGMFAHNSEIKVIIENSLAKIQSASVGSGMIDYGKNKSIVLDYINKIDELKTILTKEKLDAGFRDMQSSLVVGEEDILLLPPATKGENIKSFFSLLKQYQIQVPISLHFEFPLGGAEHGISEISIDKKTVFAAMKKYLNKLKELWRG